MNLSMMSVAMHLSGLESKHFTNGDNKLRWLYEDGARRLHASSPTLSTSSSTSSSGFNSWGSDIQQNTKEDATIVNIVPPTIRFEPKSTNFNGRNLLDLGGHLSSTSNWQFRYSELPKDVKSFFNNRSQYSRLNNDMVPLHVDVVCELCKFVESHFD